MAEALTIPAYPAVSIEPKQRACCEAVLEVAGTRYLVSEVPALPLETCDRYGQCRCTYQKWDDRRQEERRLVVAGMANQYFSDDEKRDKRRGRRAVD